MINIIKHYVILFVFVVIGIIEVSAHPGRTNRNGCHVCRTNCIYWGEVHGEKHCHNQKIELSNYIKSNKDRIKVVKVK